MDPRRCACVGRRSWRRQCKASIEFKTGPAPQTRFRRRLALRERDRPAKPWAAPAGRGLERSPARKGVPAPNAASLGRAMAEPAVGRDRRRSREERVAANPPAQQASRSEDSASSSPEAKADSSIACSPPEARSPTASELVEVCFEIGSSVAVTVKAS